MDFDVVGALGAILEEDNQGNGFVLDRLSSTKFPLFLVLMELSAVLDGHKLLLTAAWRPREENDLAGALTNQVFDAFSPERLVALMWSDFKWEYLPALVERAEGFFAELRQRKKTAHAGGAEGRRSRSPGPPHGTACVGALPGAPPSGATPERPARGTDSAGQALRQRRPLHRRDPW